MRPGELRVSLQVSPGGPQRTGRGLAEKGPGNLRILLMLSQEDARRRKTCEALQLACAQLQIWENMKTDAGVGIGTLVGDRDYIARK